MFSNRGLDERARIKHVGFDKTVNRVSPSL